MNEDGGQGGQGEAIRPPDVDAVAELIAERYPVKKGDRLTVRALINPLMALELMLDSGSDRYTICVAYLRGAGHRDPWMVTADALDAMFGMFIESGRAYRDLPAGDGVEYEGAYLRVTVEHSVPELVARADGMLEND
jgi:hypothetical protein